MHFRYSVWAEDGQKKDDEKQHAEVQTFRPPRRHCAADDAVSSARVVQNCGKAKAAKIDVPSTPVRLEATRPDKASNKITCKKVENSAAANEEDSSA